MRRIQTKVLVENVEPEVFDRIFQRVMEVHQAPSEAGRRRIPAASAATLREPNTCGPATPGDIYRLVKAISEYEGRPVRLTRGNVDRAVALYFAKNDTEPVN